MPNIKYVCLSDIYFGTDKSIISTSDTDNKNIDVATANPLIEKLMDCLKQVVRKSNCSGVKPILLLNGDAIGSASTERAEVAESFERFIELLTLSCKDLFEKIVYIPGFQDQAIWELVREKQAGKIAWMSKEHSPYATKLFSDSLPKYFHTIKKDFKPVIGSLAPLPLEVGYPSFGVSNADGSKCVVFHHGHFIESIYEFIATLKTLLFSNRKTKCGMQADSFAWVDFFWSTLNRSEEIGLGTDNLYEKLRSPNQIGEWVKNLASEVARKYDLPGWNDWMEEKTLEVVLEFLFSHVSKMEMTRDLDVYITEEAEKGLRAYLEGPLTRQILNELGRVPEKVTFIFGRTCKPFEAVWNFGATTSMDVYNTGAWVTDPLRPKAKYGANLVLVSDQLDAVALRLFNDLEFVKNCELREAGNRPASSFYKQIQAVVNFSSPPWTTFSRAVDKAIHSKRQNLQVGRVRTPLLQNIF